jgi:hypothetical protein
VAWSLTGEYFENCSCEILCPCITSSMAGPADYERCQVPLFIHVDQGEKDGVSLDGLNAVVVVDSPQVMGEGGWRVGVYIDERADESQRSALGEILSGAAGGPMAALGGLIGEQLGVKFVPIEYESQNGHKRAAVPGIMEFEIEPVTNPESGEVIEVTNTIHPMGSNLPIAKGVKGRYDDPDFGLAFDNTGKNGHFREIAWSG